MQTETILNAIDYAQNYASVYDWAVFPVHSIDADGLCTCRDTACKSQGKHPKTANGVKDASKDEGVIAGWFESGNSNIGVATGAVSGLVVVDIDVDKGADWKELMIAGIDQTVFNTPKIKTGAGYHYYYKIPAGVQIKNSANKLGRFIDVRGDGGYVVAPPSKHVSGKTYEAANELYELLEFPKAWLDKLNAPVANTNGTNGNSNGQNYNSAQANGFVVPPPSPGIILPDVLNQGSRNVEMTKIAGALRSKGLSEGAIYAAINIENQRICKPPLEDKELHQIARSVARYQPQTVLDQVSDDPADLDALLNSVRAYSLDDLLSHTREKKEVIAFHIGKRDVAMIVAGTNAGKTTLLRNVALCMAAGRPFEPFFNGSRPIRVGYFDFENDVDDVQGDIEKMLAVFTPDELEIVRANFITIPKGLMDGDVFQFNTGEKWVEKLVKGLEIEFVLVDNIAAAFDLDNENNNAEVKRKVLKPLSRMAMRYNSAFVFAHHFGKQKPNELEAAGVHIQSRGASNFENLSRAVFNMFGDVSAGMPSTVKCVKRKTDGGQNYERFFELKDDRWFHTSTKIVGKAKPCIAMICDLLVGSAAGVKSGVIVKALEPTYSRPTVYRELEKGVRQGMFLKNKNGRYWIEDEDREDEDGN